MSLQEYLNHETMRLKKDRTKLNGSTRKNNNKLADEIVNEKDAADGHEPDELEIFNSPEKDMDIVHKTKKSKIKLK